MVLVDTEMLSPDEEKDDTSRRKQQLDEWLGALGIRELIVS